MKKFLLLICVMTLTSFLGNAQTTKNNPEPKKEVKEIPAFNNDQEKAQWINDNKELYHELINRGNKTNVNSNGQNTVSSNPLVENKATVVDLEGFPVYVNTGDKAKDDENYRIAKDAWIEKNPKAYKTLNESK